MVIFSVNVCMSWCYVELYTLIRNIALETLYRVNILILIGRFIGNFVDEK